MLKCLLTWRNIVTGLERDAIGDLELVNGLKNDQPFSNFPDRQVLERRMVEMNQEVSRDPVLYIQVQSIQ